MYNNPYILNLYKSNVIWYDILVLEDVNKGVYTWSLYNLISNLNRYKNSDIQGLFKCQYGKIQVTHLKNG